MVAGVGDWDLRKFGLTDRLIGDDNFSIAVDLPHLGTSNADSSVILSCHYLNASYATIHRRAATSQLGSCRRPPWKHRASGKRK